MDKLDLICKFVYLGDKEIGETIDIYEEKLIVKMGAEFAAIPMRNVEKIEGERIYISPYDENDAFKMGKKWVEEKSKPVSIEELKIFGFGEESKTRFSVILKEIGEYDHEEDVVDKGGEVESDEMKKETKKADETESTLEKRSQDVDKENRKRENLEKELDELEVKEVEKQKGLGEGIIDKL